MMRANRALAALAVAALLVGLSGSGAGAASSGNWTTRGGNEDRQQSAEEDFGALAAVPAWDAMAHDWDNNPLSEKLGASGSQPVFVGERIYHMAGDTLWEIGPAGSAIPLFDAMNWVTGENGQPELRPSTSGITYKVINNRPYLYFGTGDNKVCILPLEEGSARCVRISDLTEPEHRIVTTPLVMLVKNGDAVQHDIVIMGDKQGRIWAIQGLATAPTLADVVKTNYFVGGWVLASPVQIGNNQDLSFVWGNDLGGSGSIGALQISPKTATRGLQFVPIWPRDIDTPAGIADGFAKDGPFIYASDIGGTMYRINTARFKVDTFPYAAQAGPMFVNAAPAVDETHVYFSIRNLGTAQANSTTPGQVIALDKESFTLKGGWVANLTAPANTNPLVWTAEPGVVLVGDTSGTLHAFSQEDGTPAPFAILPTGQNDAGQEICTPITRLELGAPGQAGEAWQNLTGISEPIIASGTTGQALMLVGLSGRDRGTLTGSLRAFRAGGAYNVAWRELDKPPASVSLGQPYQVTGELTLTPWGGAPATDRQVGIEAYWVPDEASRQNGAAVRRIGRFTATLSPTRPTPHTVTFTPTEADGAAGAIRIFANPEQLLFAPAANGQLLRQASAMAEGKAPDAYDGLLTAGDPAPLAAKVAGAGLPGNCEGAQFELLATGWAAAMADNLLTAPAQIQQSVDLSVRSLRLPQSELPCDPFGSVAASWVLHNPSDRTVKAVPYKVTVTAAATGLRWDAMTGSIDLAPGDTAQSTTFARAGCGTELRLQVELNLGPEPRPVREPDYSNNTATAGVQVAAQTSRAQGPGLTGGTSVIIVPDDCQANPDLTSRQPCLNYPNLIMP